MSSSRKFKSLCINLTLPWWKKWQWHSCSVTDCRVGLAITARVRCTRMWRRGKTCCWIFLLNVLFEHIWIKELNHLSMESNLWSLNIEIVSLVLRVCRIKSLQNWDDMNNGTACGIRLGWFQHATSRLFCLFFPSCLIGLFFVWLFDFECADPDVLECSSYMLTHTIVHRRIRRK